MEPESFEIYLHTYLLTPWSRTLLEKLTGSAASQEIPRILWNPKASKYTQIQNLMRICAVGAELLRADGRTRRS